MANRFVEALETRQLRSTTIKIGGDVVLPDLGPGGVEGGTSTSVSRAPMTYQDGVLSVYGSPTADIIRPVISHRGTLSFELYRLATPGPVVFYDGTAEGLSGLPVDRLEDDDLPKLSDVKKIVIYAGDGNDTIDVSRLSIATEAHGGGGNDSLVGGAGDDTLLGEAGRDQLTDGRGHDVLAGGAGHDLLRNLKGSDTLLGQGGNDRLVVFGEETTVNGGAGDRNMAVLNAIPDDIFNIQVDPLSVWTNTPDVKANRLTRATLYRDDDGVLKLDVALTLPGGRQGVDWDLLTDTKDDVTVDSSFYYLRPGDVTAANYITKTKYRHTFVLGDADRPNLTLIIRQGGETKLQQSVQVDHNFESETFDAVGELHVHPPS